MRGDGRVFKRGNLWWIQYYFQGSDMREPGGLNGRGAKTESEARKKLKKRIREIQGDRFAGPAAERLSVADILDSYEAHLRHKGARSLGTVISHLKPIRFRFALTRALKLTTDGVREYADERLADGKTHATVNRGVQALRAAFRLALKEGQLSRVPYFPMFKEDNAREGFFEWDEFRTVADRLPDTVADVARFGYFSGWRKSEILGLRWADVDRAAGEVRLRRSKNGEGRCLPLEIGELQGVIERRWTAREYTTKDGLSGPSPPTSFTIQDAV